MEAAKPTPRVNAELLKRFVGAEVRVVGRVARVEDKAAILEASDGKQVTVRTFLPNQYTSPFVEVVGTVGQDLTVEEGSVTSFGDNFDMATYNALVELANGKLQYLYM